MNRQLYNKYSEGRHWDNHTIEHANRFAEFLEAKNTTKSIADIGCRSGRDVQVFTLRGFRSIGIDRSLDEIYRAKNRCPEAHFMVQDAEQLGLLDDSIDAVHIINTIHYVNQGKAITEINRVLRKGGYLFIHFNLDIVDRTGKKDYHQEETEIRTLVEAFETCAERRFKRTDRTPIEHTHTILELILMKK